MEMISREFDSEWIRCVPGCDNTPDMDGFVSCLRDGTVVEPDGKWEVGIYVCARCGRIVSDVTLQVIGQRNPDGIIDESIAAAEA